MNKGNFPEKYAETTGYACKLIPFPPLAEQRAIVERVDRILSMVSELEAQVSDRRAKTDDLMRSVLREAFEGKNHGFQGANS